MKGIKLQNKVSFNDLLSFVNTAPILFTTVKNPLDYLKSYTGAYKGLINFYSNAKIQIEDACDISSVNASFIRRDYGTPTKLQNIIVDIGAHKCDFTIYSLFANKSCVVYSYEPIKDSFDVLVKNIALNSCQSRVHAFLQGVASSTGKRAIHVQVNSTDTSFYNEYVTGPTEEREIETVSLEDIFNKNELASIDLLKLDCEGAEFEILENCSPQYLQKIKCIRLEYHNIDDIHNNVTLVNFLNQNGFKVVKHVRANNPKMGHMWFENKSN